MPQSGHLLWMFLMCLNMVLLYLLSSSIHFSIMLSPPTGKKFFFKFNYKWLYLY